MGSTYTINLSWNAHSEAGHYLWHLADGNEVRVVDGHHGQQEYMEPEEAFAASIASCHLLTFIAEAAREGYAVASYDDRPVAVLGQDAQDQIVVKKVTLSPLVTFKSDSQPSKDEIIALHQRAHRKCFISQSVKSDIHLEPRV